MKIRRVTGIVAAFFFTVVLAMQASALEATVSQGGLTPEEARKTDEEIVDEVLKSPSYSAHQKQQLKEKMAMTKEIERNENAAGSSIRPFSGTQLCLLDVKPIMQEDNTKCAPATIQQTLNYIKGLENGKYMTGQILSQTAIQNAVGRGPGLNTVLNYLNQKQNKNTYVRANFTSELKLRSYIQYQYDIGRCPLIFTLKSKDTQHWPYTTDGHFTNLIGYSYPDRDRPGLLYSYYFSDPYYFKKYGSTFMDGRHAHIYKDVLLVNTNLMGSGQNAVGY